MTIKAKRKGKIEIDLTGPQGNAYALMGFATKYARQLEHPEEAIKTMIDDMKSSDYEHLIQVFDDNFGDYVDLCR